MTGISCGASAVAMPRDVVADDSADHRADRRVAGIAATDFMPDHPADDAPENDGRRRTGTAFRIMTVIAAGAVFTVFTTLVVIVVTAVPVPMPVLMPVLVPSAMQAVIMTLLHPVHPDLAVTIAITVAVTIAAIRQHQRCRERGDHGQDSSTQYLAVHVYLLCLRSGVTV